MANVKLPANTAVNLYAATGINVGTQLIAINQTSGDVRLSTSEAGLNTDHVPLNVYGSLRNETGDAGAWAISTSGGSINVREA